MHINGNTKKKHLPILLLLAANLICGLFVFRDYGLSWDEPLFYDYAEALGYAYSPSEWFSGDFNLENAYGSSGTDHANRGPAYILFARGPVKLFDAFGLDRPTAWHLVNFLTFQFGIFLFYRLTLRWMKPWPAFAAAAFFAWQPLLWGHAFINPKDMPFLVFFLGSVLFGLEMADAFTDETKSTRPKIFATLLAGFFLGLATSIRVLGPLAGLIVLIYALLRFRKGSIPYVGVYGVTALLVMFVTWPYLWTDPVQRFVEVFGFMSDNPTQLRVLFNGELYHAGELPRRYLPVMLALTLTEPVWPMFLIGVVSSLWKTLSRFKMTKRGDLMLSTNHHRPSSNHPPTPLKAGPLLIIDYFLLLAWFFIPFAYVILRRPSMYDGFRHFLFMIPPVFVFAGFAFEKIFELMRSRLAAASLATLLILPGLISIILLHPYQYAYYNSFVGGTSGAFRTYETEYWLTCYKEAIEDFQNHNTTDATIYVHREAYVAATYASDHLTVLDERGALDQIRSGDYILVNSRSNEDLKTFQDAPVVLEVRRGRAVFCTIKRIP